MNISIPWRITVHNIKNQRQLYIPFIIATSVIIAGFLVLFELATSQQIANMRSSGSVQSILFVGTNVYGLFGVTFLLSTNNTFIRQRQQQHGLFSVLGLQKSHVASIIAIEYVLLFALTVLPGLILGSLLYKLAEMGFVSIINAPLLENFFPAPNSLLSTFVVFAGAFFVMLLHGLARSTFQTPAQLFQMHKAGEQPPKLRYFYALLGVILIGIGYWISLNATEGIKNLGMFLPAALTVAAGTYLFFVAITTFIMTFLKKTKSFYYKKENFFAVSTLLFRVKEHAVGLANIAILTTGVLILVASSLAFILSIQRIMDDLHVASFRTSVTFGTDITEQIIEDTRDNPDQTWTADDDEWKPTYPVDKQLNAIDINATYAMFKKAAIEVQQNVPEITDHVSIAQASFDAFDVNGRIVLGKVGDSYDVYSQDKPAIFIRVTDINSFKKVRAFQNSTADTDITLQDNEVMAIRNDYSDRFSTITFDNGSTFTVKASVEGMPVANTDSLHAFNTLSLVVPDIVTFLEKLGINQVAPGTNAATDKQPTVGQPSTLVMYRTITHYQVDNIEEKEKQDGSYLETIAGKINEQTTKDRENYVWASSTSDVISSRLTMVNLFGTAIFIGIILSILFTIISAIIMYYKQLNEGLRDISQYNILRRIGMDNKAIQRTVSTQVLLLFFLPFGVAMTHFLVASNILSKVLFMLGVQDRPTFTYAMIVAVGIVAVIYTLTYTITSRTYYKLVTSETRYTAAA